MHADSDCLLLSNCFDTCYAFRWWACFLQELCAALHEMVNSRAQMCACMYMYIIMYYCTHLFCSGMLP